jgi:ribosome biogenesis protein MAK21
MAKKGFGQNKRSELGGSPNGARKPLESTMPTFDEASLSRLTANIDNGLKATERKSQQNTAKSTNLIAKKVLSQTREERNQKKTSNPSNTKRGVKRKQSEQSAIVNPLGPLNVSKKQKAGENNLLEDILQLEGTRDDLELVEGIESDSELEQGGEQQSNSGKTFQSELRAFAETLGIGEEIAKGAAEEEESDDIVSSEQEDSHAEEDNEVASGVQSGKVVPEKFATVERRTSHVRALDNGLVSSESITLLGISADIK